MDKDEAARMACSLAYVRVQVDKLIHGEDCNIIGLRHKLNTTFEKLEAFVNGEE